MLPPLARGTGIFINTGMSIAFEDRAEASRFFRSNASEPACETNETARSCHASDALWARRAHEMGYDSVQLRSGADRMPELLVTTRACLSQSKPIGTCPPIPLRTGEGATRTCACSESRMVLNCAGG